MRRAIAIALLAACGTKPPPPPPPPPRGGEPGQTPPELRAFVDAHAGDPWSVDIERAPALTGDDARRFVERLADDASWINGVNGCVDEGTHVMLHAGADALAVFYSCGNVWIGDDETAVTPATRTWLADHLIR